MSSSRSNEYGNTPRRDVFITGLIEISEKKKTMILGKKVIQPRYMEGGFMKSYKPDSQICQGSLQEFFTKVPYRTFLAL